MIKFRCPNCNQKLGVPDNYAGHKVRCTRCNEPSFVPKPQVQPELELVKEENPATVTENNIPNSLEVQDSDNVWDDLNLEEAESGLAAEDDAPVMVGQAPRRKPARKPASSGLKNAGDSAALGIVKGIGKMPLAIVVSTICSLAVAGILAMIFAAVGIIWYWLYFLITIAAAGGLIIFFKTRNIGLGILAAVIGLFGIFGCKVFTALAYMSKIPSAFQSEIEKSIDGQSSEVELDEIIQNRNLMFIMTALDLKEKGQINQENAQLAILLGMSGDESIEEDSEEIPEEVKMIVTKVNETLESMNYNEKEELVKAQLSNLGEFMTNSITGKSFSFIAAFIGTFNLWELFMVPLSMFSAFKIGAGKNG